LTVTFVGFKTTKEEPGEIFIAFPGLWLELKKERKKERQGANVV